MRDAAPEAHFRRHLRGSPSRGPTLSEHGSPWLVGDACDPGVAVALAVERGQERVDDLGVELPARAGEKFVPGRVLPSAGR
jgi:hypothetical protein